MQETQDREFAIRKNSIPCGQSARQRADHEITSFRIEFVSADQTPDPMHSATLRGLGGRAMVTEVVRIAHSVRGVAELCSVFVQQYAPERTFGSKRNRFRPGGLYFCFVFAHHEPNTCLRTSKKFVPGRWYAEILKSSPFGLRTSRSAFWAPSELRASPRTEYCTAHYAHELYSSGGASGVGGLGATPTLCFRNGAF